MLNRQNAASRVNTYWFIIWASCYQRYIGLRVQHIKDLAIPEKENCTSLHDVLKDEVLVIITDFVDV